MPDKTKTIGVRVTEDQYEKINAYAENHNEFDSASRMMRVLATRHITNESNDPEPSIDTDELVNAIDVALSGVNERLDRMENHLVAIDSATSDDDETDKLAQEIYAGLPVYESEDDLPGMFEVASGLSQDSHLSEFKMAQLVSSPSTWADYFDTTNGQARKACMRMLEYFPDVEFVTEEMGGLNMDIGDGQIHDIQVAERRYFKTEDA